MSFHKRTYRSTLTTQKRLLVFTKIAALFATKPASVVFKKGNFRARADQCSDVTLTPGATHNNIEFGRPNASLNADGAEETLVTCIADTGHKATASLATTTPIVLTSALMGTARNTNTFQTVVNAAAANPTSTVLAAFTGTGAAIVLTITPNDGTHNSATPVTLTTAQVAELINTGAVAGKSVTLTDGSSLRTKQTATGGGAATLANSGEGDTVTGTFSGGVASNLNSKYFTFYSASDATKYYAWLNVNGQGVDPAVAAATGKEVAIAAGASATTIATALAAAIDGGDFAATADGTTVDFFNTDQGPATDTADGAAATGFTFTKLGELEAYDLSDILLFRRIRSNKWLIEIKGDASPTAL